MKEHLTAGSTWLRVFFMLIFAIIFYITLLVTAAVILFQLGSLLFTGKLNQRLLPFGYSLSIYASELLLYLTYNSDKKPWPYPSSEWPSAGEQQREYLVKFPPSPSSEDQHQP